MFKKPFKTQQQNLLKSSDKRKLRDNLLRNFPDIKEDQLSIVLPVKEDVVMQKISGTHMLIYMVGNNPIFFDLDGRGDFYPTLYTLWKIPNIVPSLIIHPPVARYVLGGADLMLPGVILPESGIDGLGEIFLGDKRAICIKGVGDAIAIGSMATSTKDLKKTGMKGKAIKVLHYIKDNLWLHGSKEIPQSLLVAPQGDSDDDEEDQVEGQSEVGQTTEQLASLDVKDGQVESTSDSASSSTTENTPAASNSAPDVDIFLSSFTSDMDKLVEQCFIGALRHTKDKDLPILVSTFYSSKMIPNRPPGTTVDIKKSSYKKISEFLNAMAKLHVVETKNMNDVLYIVDIDRGHQKYKEYKEGATVAKEEADLAAKEAPSDTIQVLELFGIPQPIAPLFGNPSKEQLFTHEEVNECLWYYVKEKNLDPQSSEKQKSTTINLDTILADFLRKKNEPQIPKQEFLSLVKAKLKPYHAITRNGETTISKGDLKTIQIIVEQKQGRYVTKITNLEAFGIKLDEISKEWQHLFATSTSTQPGLGKGAGSVIVIQGSMLKEAAKFLLTKYKIPKKYFEEQDKTKKSKK